MANVVRILVTAKDEVSGAFDRIQDKATLLSKTDIGKGMLQGAGIAAFGAIQSAAYGALDAVTTYVAGSVEAFREEEVGVRRLDGVLKANVQGWDGNTDAIEKNINAMVRSTGFSDGDMRDSLSKLIPVTKDVDEAFRLQATAMDLARLRGISLADASQALVKVEAGQYRMLKDLGIVLEKGASQTEALAAVQAVAGGQMDEYMKSGAASADILENRLGDLQETIGEKLSPALLDATEKTLGLMDALDEEVPLTTEERLLGVLDALAPLLPMSEATKDLVGDMRTEFEELGITADDTAAALIDFRGGEREAMAAGRKLTDASGDLAGGIDDVGDEAADAAKKLKDLKKAANDALDAFLEATLGPEELKLELRNSKDELGENQREAEKLEDKIRRFKDAGKPVGELKDNLADLRLEIIKDKEDAIRATARLEDMGEVPMGSTETAIKRLIGPLDRVQQEAWDAYAALRALAGAGDGGGGGGGGRKGGKASGGYVAPYTSSLVGEYRPEMVTAGSSGLYVNPSPAAAPAGNVGGGGPVVVQLVVDGRVLAEQTAPGVTAWQQDRRILARA